MDDNRFLSSYKHKDREQQAQQENQEQPERREEPLQEAPPALRFEQANGFTRPGGYEHTAAEAPSRKIKLAPWIIGAALLVAVVAGLLLFLNRGVPVMDLAGWTLNDAQLWASDNGVKLQVDERFDDNVEAGKVAEQSPAKGGTVAKGGFVRVTVSKGHDLSVTLPLPDLMAMSKEEVDKWAAENFMTKVRVTAEFSDSVESGRVIRFEVNDNTVVNEVRRNSPVYVVVSKGPDESAVLVTIPDFREKTVSDSYVFANENGVILAVTEQYDDFAPKGSIIGQSVKKDEKVKKGETVTLTVSKGKKIVMQDFAGFSKQKAGAVAAELGIPAAITEKYSPAKAGSFISQSIPAGSVYESGDVLELAYSLGNTVIVGSYVGQTRDAIEAWAKELNDQGAAITISATLTQSSQPKGRILSQSKANTAIGITTTIRITVSLGKAVFVPDFVAPAGSGYDVAVTREKAMAMCEALNIVPVFVKSSKSGRLPGEIWYQSIAAGKEVTEETTITLKYNPATVTYAVPDFTGMTEAEVRAAGYLMKFDIKFEVSDTVEAGFEGKIFRQSLTSGATVEAGAALTLTVGAAGP